MRAMPASEHATIFDSQVRAEAGSKLRSLPVARKLRSCHCFLLDNDLQYLTRKAISRMDATMIRSRLILSLPILLALAAVGQAQPFSNDCSPVRRIVPQSRQEPFSRSRRDLYCPQ